MLEGFDPGDTSNFVPYDFNYFSSKISILYPSFEFDLFYKNITQLSKLSDHQEYVEVLVGLTNDDRVCDYVSCLSGTKFKWKIVYYCNKDSIEIYDDLARLSFGKFIWLFNDLNFVQSANWDSNLINNYSDKCYPVYSISNSLIINTNHYKSNSSSHKKIGYIDETLNSINKIEILI